MPDQTCRTLHPLKAPLVCRSHRRHRHRIHRSHGHHRCSCCCVCPPIMTLSTLTQMASFNISGAGPARHDSTAYDMVGLQALWAPPDSQDRWASQACLTDPIRHPMLHQTYITSETCLESIYLMATMYLALYSALHRLEGLADPPCL